MFIRILVLTVLKEFIPLKQYVVYRSVLWTSNSNFIDFKFLEDINIKLKSFFVFKNLDPPTISLIE